MLSGYSFHPRAWAALAAAGACAAGIMLGNWQSGRAEEKRTRAVQRDAAMQMEPRQIGSATTNAAALVGKRVAAQGRFLPEHTVLLDNKLRNGRPGYEVVTPLRLDGMHVLVNRGWVAAGTSRTELPDIATPLEPLVVEGLALTRLPQALAAGEARGPVRQNLDLERFEKESGLRLHPIVIEQHSALPDGLLREWPRPDTGADKNRAYALQWYSLAALAVVLFLVLSFRRVGAR